jgi:hypothetical protein
MADLAGKKEPGGAVGDTYRDMYGVWEIKAVYGDGRYAWALRDEPKAFDEDSLLDYCRSLDRRLTIIETTLPLLAELNAEIRRITGLIGQTNDLSASSVYEALDQMKKLILTTTQYVGTTVPAVERRVADLEGRIQ